MKTVKPFDPERWMQNGYFAMGMAIKCAFAVPFLTISESLLRAPAQAAWIWCHIASLAVAVALGTLWTRTVAKRAAQKDRRPIPAGLLRVFGYIVVVSGLACASCIPHGPSLPALAAFVVTLITFICCMTCARLDYKDMLTLGQLAGLGLLYALTIGAEALLHRFFGLSFTRSPMIICLIIVCACAAVMLNQGNLEALASRRRKISLPMRVRTNNLKLVLVTLAILLVGYIFRVQIVWAADKVLYALWRCIYYLIRGAVKLLEWLGSLGASTDGDAALPGAGSDIAAFPPAEESGYDSTWIAILLFAAIVIFFAVKLGPRLFRFVSAWLRRLLARIAELFGRAAAQDDSHEGLFSDSEEELDAQYGGTAEKKNIRALRRQFRGSLKRYDGLSGVERVREGYRLMLEALSLRGTPADRADTVHEIPGKLGDEYLSERFSRAAATYDAARYGGRAPEDGVPEFDAAVKDTCNDAARRR